MPLDDTHTLAEAAMRQSAILTSPEVNLLLAALIKAKQSFPSIPATKKVTVTTKEGRKYTFSYAPLNEIIPAIEPHLFANSMILMQIPTIGPDGRSVLVSRLLHTSGQWMESTVPILAESAGPKAFGSAVTHLRRYVVIGLLNLAPDEDDDGSAAQGDHIEQVFKPIYKMLIDGRIIDCKTPKDWVDAWSNRIKMHMDQGTLDQLAAEAEENKGHFAAIAKDCQPAARDVQLWISEALDRRGEKSANPPPADKLAAFTSQIEAPAAPPAPPANDPPPSPPQDSRPDPLAGLDAIERPPGVPENTFNVLVKWMRDLPNVLAQKRTVHDLYEVFGEPGRAGSGQEATLRRMNYMRDNLEPMHKMALSLLNERYHELRAAAKPMPASGVQGAMGATADGLAAQ